MNADKDVVLTRIIIVFMVLSFVMPFVIAFYMVRHFKPGNGPPLFLPSWKSK